MYKHKHDKKMVANVSIRHKHPWILEIHFWR